MDNPVKKIVILGGGTAGWMTAAALARATSKNLFRITLIESDQIGTVGVGEATIPHIREFNYMLGIDEQDFMREVNATYKLGIRFKGWGSPTSDYFHPFGTHGCEINHIAFHHYWLKIRQNDEIAPFDDFSLAVLAAKKHRFAPPPPHNDETINSFSYAYHIDANAYAAYLRRYAETKGIERKEGKVQVVNQDKHTGNITSLTLDNELTIEGDLFIDCSGFSSILLGRKLNVPYESWNSWLLCDTAFALQSELTEDPVPYTTSTAVEAGWQWRIPLRKRVGNGLVYCSNFLSDLRAQTILRQHTVGASISEPRKINFTAGMHARSWEKNCVAIGLASGFLEPLESTSIYLIQLGIYKLLELLPVDEICDIERETFNKEMRLEYERVRDFLILHYKLNFRDDNEFWLYCKNMQVPDSLENKISLFVDAGYVVEYKKGLFAQPSWLSVYFGQGLFPNNPHPIISSIPLNATKVKLEKILTTLNNEAEKLPYHTSFLYRTTKTNLAFKKPTFSLYGDRFEQSP